MRRARHRRHARNPDDSSCGNNATLQVDGTVQAAGADADRTHRAPRGVNTVIGQRRAAICVASGDLGDGATCSMWPARSIPVAAPSCSAAGDDTFVVHNTTPSRAPSMPAPVTTRSMSMSRRQPRAPRHTRLRVARQVGRGRAEIIGPSDFVDALVRSGPARCHRRRQHRGTDGDGEHGRDVECRRRRSCSRPAATLHGRRHCQRPRPSTCSTATTSSAARWREPERPCDSLAGGAGNDTLTANPRHDCDARRRQRLRDAD